MKLIGLRCFSFLLLLAAFGCANNAFAQLEYELFFDQDLNSATGCSVNLPALGESINGVEARLVATVDQSTQVVDSVEVATCSGSTFGVLTFIDGGYPVALNAGTNGADAVELAVPQNQVVTDGGLVQVFAVASNTATGNEDSLFTRDGSATGLSIFLGSPAEVPALSVIGLTILGVVLIAISMVILRRRQRLAGISLLLFASAVFAMTFAADGDIADWTGVAPEAIDPEGDGSLATDSSVDLNALFIALEADMAFFRMDVVDVENSGPTAVAGAATTTEDTVITLTLTGSDPEGTPLSFAIDTPPANGALGAITGIDDSTASVDYTPNADFNGAEGFSFTVNDGGLTSTAADFDLTVTAVNDAPSFIAGPDQTILEDAGAQSIAWATGISAGPADEAGQALTFTITDNSNPTLFAVAPTVADDGALTYTPADDANGVATITLELMDDGGTVDGGVDTSPAQTFTITVTAVNDAPTFTIGPDQTVLEDAGPQTVTPWATGLFTGPADESGQTLTGFTVASNSNPALFSAGPAIAADGSLTYTPADDANGTATIGITLSDDGGTADGGVDTSAEQTFTITVTAVNDAPSFTVGPNQTLLEDAGPQTVNPWATSISAGPVDESGQTLSFNVTANDNTALFSAQPSVSADGTLTYTPADDANGVANITLELVDDGGTVDGGVDTSPAQTFTVTVTAVNDAPTFTIGPDQTVLEDAGPQTVTPWATGLSTGPADESGQALTGFTVASNSNPALFSAGPAIAADGSLTYTPVDDTNGTATIGITLSDDGGTADGGVDTSAEQTFTITVTAVNDAPSFIAGPDQTVLEDAGAQSLAWATGISAGPADEAGQAPTFNITDNSNPTLFAVAPAVASDGVLTYTPADDANGVANITLELADDGGTVDGGVDSSPTQTFTITVTAVNDAPTFTVGPDQTVLEDAGSQTVAPWVTTIAAGPIDEVAQALTFTITSNSNPGLFAAAPAVAADGSLTFTPTDNLSGVATIGVELMDNGGTANSGVDTSAIQTFIITVNAVDDPPVVTGETFDTIGNTQLQVATTQSITPSVFVLGSLLDNDTDIDSGSLTASLNTATAGAIVTVSADGTFTYIPPAGMSGTDSFTYDVSDATSSVTGTVNISFVERVWYVDNTAAAGGSGRSSDPFDTLAEAEATDADNDVICIAFGDGTSTGYDAGYDIDNTGIQLLGEHVGCSISSGVNSNAGPTELITPVIDNRPLIDSGAAASTIIVDGSTQSLANVIIQGLNISAEVDGIQSSVSTNTMGVTIDDNIIEGTNDGIQFDASGTSTASLTLTNNTVQNGDMGLNVNGSDTAQVNFTVDNNIFDGFVSDIINVTHAGGNGSFTGTIINNTLNDSGVTAETNSFLTGISANGINVLAEGSGTTGPSGIVLIDNNTVTRFNLFGIQVMAGAGTASIDATVTNNEVLIPGPFSGDGIRVESGNGTAGETNAVCLNITNNDAASLAFDEGIQVEQFAGTIFELQSLGLVDGTDSNMVEDFIDANNNILLQNGVPSINGSNVRTASRIVAYTDATCTLPPTP